MGALRVNLTNGTTNFIALEGYSQAFITSSDTLRTIIRGVKLAGGQDDWVIVRFTTSPTETIWRYQMEVAYDLIAAAPIKYGYPNLGTSPNDYIKYDASKFGVAALEQALTDQQEDNIPYTEKTAICPDVLDPDQAGKLKDAISDVISEAKDETEALEEECAKAVDAGNTFTWPDGTICDSAACCSTQAAIFKDQKIEDGLDSLGLRIEHKHQYLWKEISTEGGE